MRHSRSPFSTINRRWNPRDCRYNRSLRLTLVRLYYRPHYGRFFLHSATLQPFHTCLHLAIQSDSRRGRSSYTRLLYSRFKLAYNWQCCPTFVGISQALHISRLHISRLDILCPVPYPIVDSTTYASYRSARYPALGRLGEGECEDLAISPYASSHAGNSVKLRSFAS